MINSIDNELYIFYSNFFFALKNLHADGDIGFSREYEAIQSSANDLHLSCEHSQMPENKSKNRYLNIVAYDHSRVILKSQGLQKKSSDYINANYIGKLHRISNENQSKVRLINFHLLFYHLNRWIFEEKSIYWYSRSITVNFQ